MIAKWVNALREVARKFGQMVMLIPTGLRTAHGQGYAKRHTAEFKARTAL
jgi:hypothetical protein